jgi:hypothetical protein
MTGIKSINKTRKVTIILEVSSNNMTNDEIHEALCLLIHEGQTDLGLTESVIDIEVVD